MLFPDMNETKQNMAPQNSTLINLINDDVKSIISERLSPIEMESQLSSSDEEVRWFISIKTLFEVYEKENSRNISITFFKSYWPKKVLLRSLHNQSKRLLYISPWLQDDYDEEIPIFIGQVPRYVSGINRKTTCNDIIKGKIMEIIWNSSTSLSHPVLPVP